MPIIPHVKLCRKCGLTKPLHDFSHNKRAKDGLQYACKLCQQAEIKAYRQAHPEYKSIPDLEYQRRYYQTNRDRVLRRMAKNYQDDPDKYKARRRRYESTPMGKIVRRATYTRYQSRKTQNHQLSYTAHEIVKRCDQFYNRCAYCGTDASLQMDHFLPIASGGPDVLSNLIPACSSCNTSKQDKDPYTWFSAQSFYQVKQWGIILKVLGKTQATYQYLPLL